MAVVTAKQQIKSPKYYRSGTTLFLSFFWKNPFLVISALLMNFITTFLRLLPAVFIGRALDILLAEGYGRDFIITASLIPIVALVNFFVSFGANYAFAISSVAWERDIRQEYFDVIQSHSLTFHNENNSSNLLSLGMNEIQMARHGIMPSLSMIMNTFFSIILVLIFMNSLVRPELVYFTAIGFVIYFILAYRYAKRVGPVRNQLSESVGTLTEKSQEIFRGIDVVRGLGSQDVEINRFDKNSKDYAILARRESRMSAFYWPALILLIMTAVIFSVSILEIPETLSVGDLVQVLGLLLILQFTNFMMPFALINMRAALVNSGRLSNKMNYEDEFQNVVGETVIEVDWKSDLEFHNVSFSYGPKFSKTLRNLSFKIPAYSKVALIGGPGSGKTTFLKLLLQLYLPSEGMIKIGDAGYNQITSNDVRKHVAMVEQEIFLFSGTIRDNIAFTNPEASDDEILNAAKAAQAFEFIERMADGIDTVIGERGVTLSGGQKQRLAIARAILANPEILLLDDSSSALDSKTEMLIRKALDNLSQNRLTITVTQRLTSLIQADLIILLDKGEIIGLGNHSELYETSDKYRMIFELLPESERLNGNGKTNNTNRGGRQ